VRACVSTRCLDRIGDDVGEPHAVLELELKTARVELRDEKQIADEALQALGAAVHDGEEPLLLPASPRTGAV
jgi:hypothetical protein